MVPLAAGVALAMSGLAVLAAPLVVEGETDCPSPRQVHAKLGEMLGEGARLRERAFLRSVGDAVGVELFGADGGELMRRLVPRSASCAELARVVAVVLAARLQQIHPDLAPAVLPLPPRPPDLAASAPAVARAAPVFRHDLDLGLGLVGSLTGGGATLGGTAQLHLFAPGGGLGLHAGVAADGTRELPFRSQAAPDRAARWRRIPVSVGPGWRWVGHRLALDARAGLVAAWTSLEGRNFVSPAEASRWSLASFLGARAVTRTGAIVGWLDAQVFFWPPQRAAVLREVPEQVDLPRVGLLLSLGAGLCTGCRPAQVEGEAARAP